MEFTARETFFCPELGSEYVTGLSYRAGEQDKRLRELVARWVAEGKVSLGRNGASVKGH